jgi:hypothetical protein
VICISIKSLSTKRAFLSPESNPRFMFCSNIYKITNQTSDPKNMDQNLLKIASENCLQDTRNISSKSGRSLIFLMLTVDDVETAFQG